ncbi:uncharacterized protein Eint_060500 [Encephalitozoon intestinalis ATCC 50506]|uniref:Uncharacterized protein n=1 Tax=Encephalitozoon intestinalis (strain ATCC 50506) TaxID=876142 RepID=E0S7H9_ENCIT|nr:uncharacterized protein Eint_060500 [Encephalitozoon intestinalis ATCC 50506]ADM11658.1 hypothetical protein Eint_060500 [Encephalitozoon intestinalis ATCC 50506]UTX45393.1 membrane protein [Encephalitozoon intestinalis]
MNLGTLIPFLALALCATPEASGDSGTSADSSGQLAFAVPVYATSGGNRIVNAVYAIVLLVAIAVINLPRKSLEQTQYAATSALGAYFLISHILQSTGIALEMDMIAAGIVAVLAAVISYNKMLRSLLFALISAYGTTYFAVLIVRLESILFAGILGVVLFFVYIFLGKMKEDGRLLVAMAKADVSSLGFASFINVWGAFDMFGGMHGINASEGLFQGFLFGGIIIALVFAVVFTMNYFSEWTQEKMNSAS